MSVSPEHEQLARAYLTEQLGEDAPEALTEVACFTDSPLEGEGAMTIYAFSAGIGGNPTESFFVVAGVTAPNYYPAWDLSPDEIFSLHLGTRFMLVLEVQQLPLAEVPPSATQDIRTVLNGVITDRTIGELEPVVAFRAAGYTHLVCRCHIGDQDTYVLGGNLPLGIYPRLELPAHVIYRLHLGNVIRREDSDGPPE